MFVQAIKENPANLFNLIEAVVQFFFTFVAIK
jgi:hypothetical protein